MMRKDLPDSPTAIAWEKEARENFDAVIGKVPAPLRSIAAARVSQKAQDFARKEGRGQINQKDVVDAFFAETPFGFHGPLKMDMEALGIDYKEYGYG